MHELGLCESLVEAVEGTLDHERVTMIRLEVGVLVAVVPEALRFCFDVCARGTRLEGARLEIDAVAGRGECRSCGAGVELAAGVLLCRCGSADLRVTQGLELKVREIETVDERSR